MSKRWVVHTLDSLKARCVEIGDCWIWQGATSGPEGKPSMRRNGKCAQPRRVVREIADGKPVPGHLEVAAKCGDKQCISPHCSVVTTHRGRAKLASQRGAFDNPLRNMRIAMRLRATSHISEELIQMLKASTDTAKVLSQQTGVSESHIKAIRRGDARKSYASPFAGLFAANDSKRRAA